MEVLYFGRLAEITGFQREALEELQNTDELLLKLKERFPGLTGMKFSIAVNNEIINGNVQLNKNSIIACMPPFSGG